MMPRVNCCAAIAASLVISVLPASGQVAATDPRLAGFDEYVAKAVKDWNTAGLAIAVVKDGQVVFQNTYGVREVAKPDQVDSETIFAIASTTKAMTAAAIGMLVDEGKLKWDDPVTKHLPALELYDPFVTREITIRDLLTHRTGLGGTDFLWYLNDLPPLEITKRLRFVKPAYSLRAGFVYQNVMYVVAGQVVGAASGIPWEEFLASRIFRPLGMTRTVASYGAAKTMANAASPHFRFGDTLTLIENASVDAAGPAGGVWSSISDMSKWVRFLLDSAKIGNTRFLKPETFAELFKPQVIVPADEFYPTLALTKPHWMTYGLGWFQHDYRGRMVNFHTGSIDGTVALMGLVPDERLGVYVFANTDHVEIRHALMYRVIDLFLGDSVRDWSTELKKLYAARSALRDSVERASEGKRIRGTKPSLALEKYAGTYSDSLFGNLVVTAERGKLRARISSQLVGNMEHWQYDTFLLRWDKSWMEKEFMTFTIGNGGVPALVQFTGFTLRREGR